MHSLLLFLVPLLAASDVLDADDRDTVETLVASERLVEGTVNWTDRTLTVYGEGVAPGEVSHPVQRRLMGFRAAKLVAYRNLLDIIGEVHVDSRTTVSMAMVTSDSIRATVEGIVRGARVIHDSQREDAGLYSLALKMPISGAFAEAVLPSYPNSAGIPRRELPPEELPAEDSLIVFEPSQPHTGLIVDARGLDLRPSMSPRVIDENGRVIYDGSHVDRAYAVDIGVVGYDRDMQRALVSERLGGDDAHPFVVRAERVAGLFNGDVVISKDSGIRVLMANMEGSFLSECRVTFVLGSEVPMVEAAFLDSMMVDSGVTGNEDEDDILGGPADREDGILSPDSP